MSRRIFNFGGRGWSVIATEGLLICIAAGSVSHGLNIITPTLSQAYGIDNNTLLYWATPASFGGVLGSYVLAKAVERWGSKRIIVISLALCGVAFGMLGTVGSTVTGFFAAYFAVCFFGTGYGYVGGMTLVNMWFPKKCSAALGFVTMGQTMSTGIYVPLLSWFISLAGPKHPEHGFWGMSAIMFVLMIQVALTVRNLPEEVGHTPDNEPMTVEEAAASRAAAANFKPVYTTWQLLKMKDIWLMALGTGCVYIMVVGVMSQMVPRQMSVGIDQNQAVLNLSIAAFIGVPGAFVWGWLGQRVPRKAAAIVYCAWWIVAISINAYFSLNPVTLWISLVMLGFSFGGATNLAVSIVADKFPRSAFVSANAVVQPIQGLVRSMATAILAFGLQRFGGPDPAHPDYAGPYTILIGIGLLAIVLFWFTNTKPDPETLAADNLNTAAIAAAGGGGVIPEYPPKGTNHGQA
ncbi:MAG: MFS transporter [Propionibacteriaceae bacterium]|jgi:sugar phosphate permease|nr:MFS transporter [Propionibacteriaceae bacterium]